jgi:hypothetical protein
MNVNAYPARGNHQHDSCPVERTAVILAGRPPARLLSMDRRLRTPRTDFRPLQLCVAADQS